MSLRNAALYEKYTSKLSELHNEENAIQRHIAENIQNDYFVQYISVIDDILRQIKDVQHLLKIYCEFGNLYKP
jgi:hypothetical protein